MGQALRVRLLGGLEVEGIETAHLGSRKARRLLKRLALARGAAVSVDALTDTLWSDSPPANPADQVSVLVSRLRRVLGAGRIRHVEAGYVLAVDWLDVDALADLVAEAQHRLRAGGIAPARSAARAALELLRGPVLPEEPDALWVVVDRVAAEGLTCRARILIGEAALAAGDGWEAVEPAQRALLADPYDEGALRLLMSAYVATERPARALAAYAEMSARLAEDLGTDPAPETAALHVAVLQGRGQPVAVSTPAPGRPELPGRHDQLVALDAALARAVSGEVGFVVIEGEPGIGKTALLDTWLAGAHDPDVIVLRTEGTEPGSALPLDPVLSVLSACLRGLDHTEADNLLGAERELVGPLLGRSDDSGPGPTHPALTEFEPGRAFLFTALEAVLSRLTDRAPVVLVIDDAHLVDQATAEWLHHCLRRLRDQRVLLVAARRPDEGPEYAGTQHLLLDTLDKEAAATVVGEARVDELYARTDGHPLFLVELCRLPDVALPDSVRVVAERSCERAGIAAPTLRAAAVLGPTVDLDLLAHVLRRVPAELLDHLEAGVRRHLLTEHRDGFTFTHQLVREALVAGTSGPRRALLHLDAARALAGRISPEPLRVAHHAQAGGDFPLAARSFADAGEIALGRYDHDEALRLVGEALALDDTGTLRLSRARIMLATGQYSHAASDAAIALAAGEGAAALEVAAQVAYHLREFPRALRLAEDGVALAPDAEVRASCAVLAGRTELAVGRLDRAGQWLGGEHVRTCQPVRAVADLHLATLRNQQGEGEIALSLVSDEGALPETHEPFAGPHRHLQAGHALGLLGRPLEALAAFERLERSAQLRHATRFAGRSPNYRAWILRNVGAYGEADECNELAFEEAGRYGIAEPRSHALLDLADGRLRRTDLDGAAVLLRRAGQEGAGVHALRWRHELRFRLLSGRLALAQGSISEAIEVALEVLEDAQRLTVRRYAVLAELLLARARHLTGDGPSPDSLSDLIAALDSVAPLEAWYVTAEMARAFEVDAWSRLAARRAQGLADRAGPWAEQLHAAAAAVFEGMAT